jgi:hypothetical protein
MPVLTVREAFEELLRRIELDTTRVSVASQRYNAVKHRIESNLPGKQVSQVGSFQRKTKIRPRDENAKLDIDAIVSFGEARSFEPFGQGITPQVALQIVRKALVADKTYRLMNPDSDAPTVVLEYADGFKIELIPSFKDLTGTYPRASGPACYLIGDSRGTWIPADYDYDAQVIRGLNQSSAIAATLVPGIKMMKAFLRNLSVGLKSFHIEILCALVLPRVIADWEAQHLNWGYQHLLAHFLKHVRVRLVGPVSLPGSYSPAVDSGLASFRLQQLGSTLEKLGDTAWKICELDDKLHDTASALDCWRRFFGEPFPS